MKQMDQIDPSAATKKSISPVSAAIIGFLVGVLLTSMLSNWQDVKDGWRDGWRDGSQGKPTHYQAKPADKQ